MKIKLANKITLTDVPDNMTRKIYDTFTVENQVWLDNKKMNRWNGKTNRWLTYYMAKDGVLAIPRGALGLIIHFCKELNVRFELIDEIRKMDPTDFVFNANLKGYQTKAVQDILKRDFDVLQAPTGSGKTVIALSAIAERRQPTLVIVHNKTLLNQWMHRIETFLNIPMDRIGIVGDGKKMVGPEITVGIVNSIYPVTASIRHHFGHIVVDECHRCPSRTFTKAVTAFDSKYMLGLSATPYRRDGLTKLIGWHLGPIIKIEKNSLGKDDIIYDVEFLVRETDFTCWADPSAQYAAMLSELCKDPARNALIIKDVMMEVRNGGGTCLVLTDRKSHCENLAAMLLKRGIKTDILTGDTPRRERDTILARLDAGNARILVATGQLIGEGFDSRSLHTLFLVTPVKFEGRLLQYIGRVLRSAHGKHKAKIYDYVDPIGVLRASAEARARIYRQWQ